MIVEIERVDLRGGGGALWRPGAAAPRGQWPGGVDASDSISYISYIISHILKIICYIMYIYSNYVKLVGYFLCVSLASHMLSM